MSEPAVRGDGARFSGDGSGELARLRQHIMQTRAELGATVEALAARADPHAWLRGAATQAKIRVRQSLSRAAGRPLPWLVLLGVSAGMVAILVRNRNRNRDGYRRVR